jgi:hypothetical protein
MDTGSLLLIFSILILVALFVVRPFLVKQSAKQGQDYLQDTEIRNLDHRYSALMAEKERLLRALNDLDVDQSMGKIPEEDYPIQRTYLLTEGARVLKDLDEIEEQIQKITLVVPIDNRVDPTVSADSKGIQAGDSDPIEEMVASRRRLRDEKSAGFCPRCGKVIQKSDLFCPRCGNKVVA